MASGGFPNRPPVPGAGRGGRGAALLQLLQESAARTPGLPGSGDPTHFGGVPGGGQPGAPGAQSVPGPPEVAPQQAVAPQTAVSLQLCMCLYFICVLAILRTCVVLYNQYI